MSVTQKRLTGWGRTAPTVAQVLTTPDADEIATAVRKRLLAEGIELTAFI